MSEAPAVEAVTVPPPTATTPIVIVGHVDHGKSTLIGRLLYDTGNLAEGRVDAVIASSERRGLKVEWSFLLDSLQAERDQGVTIDSTRLPFVLDGRPFVIVDAPGHRQFLRNMVTGAAGAGAAVLVVDIAEGAQEQTRRHAVLLRLIGVRHVIVVLNKADLLDFDQDRIASASSAVLALLERLEIRPVVLIPASARHGDNVAARSEHTPWYEGPTLTEALAQVPPLPSQAEGPLRLPVQDVYRFDDRRLVVGRIESGRLKVGDAVVVGPHGTLARIAAIEGWHTNPQIAAVAGQSVALVLEPDVVVDRGDLLHPPGQPPLRAARLRARLFWLRQEPLRVGESFRLRLATAEHTVTVAAIESVLQIEDLTEHPADHVPPEGFAEITLAAPEGVLFDPFAAAGAGGRGVLVDRHQQIVGGAPLLGPAPLAVAAPSVFPVDSAVSTWERAQAKGHRSGVFWMTGLPGAGKSTIARATEALLFRHGLDVAVLDGDTLRARLSRDLGFSPADRHENVRRAAVVARMMADAGMVVLVALISPRAVDRTLARTTVGEGFHEIHIHADRDTCERRDPKGLYAAARAGKLAGFTGIDAPYEIPEAPDLVVDTTAGSAAQAAERLAAHIEGKLMLPSARAVKRS
ncbi:Sulfate adenylyltransferase subunit 1 / Adenylyl-sulfate kinase [Rhodovastum atsumiense]|uniref:Adenylyl-sulfate kinase n=1 Tax=Rhodovastum atsumiense TaxID=504468 RepID=A0A5M6IRC7_9PROT|nr:adenylyl-sulfate kinase [Rhodovastum atsumiense]KAA5610731.1 adenylyl-sulfate kinase [Rhodovastum atsumiense]CAH2604355.1 Sulfate adenylyltransferase subunit 1 / Adenylyl-sulfate kinase [Rhodovastum atsumiense]